jgi:CRP-like cAMP-binding protein
MSPASVLAGADLFSALSPDALEDVARFMTAVTFEPGEVVFRQGDAGDRLIVVAEGELEAVLEVPGAEPMLLSRIAPGQIVGELSLLGDGKRTATVRALAPTTGWALARSAFEVLRHDVRPAALQVLDAIGRQAITRLNGLYRRCAQELVGDHPGDLHPSRSIGEVASERGEIDYLGGILFFRDFTRDEIVDVTVGMPRLAVPRGAVLAPPGEKPTALWIVARGAIETTMRTASSTRSLRLAGPGRAVGHVGLLGDDAFVDRIESRARERSILLEVPWPRVAELLGDDASSSRRFTAALWTDAVRALQHGERPLARTRTRVDTIGLSLRAPAR